MAWYLAGGPLASLAAALATLPLALFGTLLPSGGWPISIGLRLSLYMTIGLPWLFLLNILPFIIKGLPSDGFLLSRLAQGKRRGEMFAYMAFASNEVQSGHRFRSLPRELVEALVTLNDGSEEELAAKYTAYAYYRDSELHDKASTSLKRALELAGTVKLKNPILRDAVFIEAAFNSSEPAEARALFQRADSAHPLLEIWRKRAEAKVLSLEWRHQEAREALTEFLEGAENELRTAPERLESAKESVKELIELYPM